MSHSAPLNLLVSRRIKPDRHDDFHRWIRRGEALASAAPGYLGSGLLKPPDGDDNWQILFRFSDQASLDAWAASPDRLQWLAEGEPLLQHSRVHCAQGVDSWFGAGAPPRWKQAVMIWLVFFPVSLCFTLLLGDSLARLPIPLRVLCSTLMMTPVMVFFFIPLSSRLLRRWLQAAPARPVIPLRSH
ncbi:antibiotic biosynthesis monooxygenase [uncultured Aquitalea sp.]|uniref:antibiotic biosynthesis monooxygenase n=1 Tax=uncultured Aquitalea sp. TaxID=540272 RepID=UPI0025D0121B|nr:antibiotic biosynthesis monooxygenase [uncultured Aquitalea sp.]